MPQNHLASSLKRPVPDPGCGHGDQGCHRPSPRTHRASTQALLSLHLEKSISLCPRAARRARNGAFLLHKELSILLWMPLTIRLDPDCGSTYSHSSLRSPLLSASFILFILSFILSTCASAVLGAGGTEEHAIRGPCLCKYPKVKISKGQPIGFCQSN